MNVEYDKSFYRDIKKLRDKEPASKLKEIIEKFKSSKDLTEIKNIKKIQGTDNLYRVKIKNYRLGFELQENTVTLLKFLHRKDIYKYFP